MIIYTQSNLFKSPAKTLVNTVNTFGVMGKGIALDFKNSYPNMFEQYKKICERKELDTGKLWLYKTPNKWILNFPTKKHWRGKSKLEYLEDGLKKFVDVYQLLGITSISFPELGVGNGGLNWERQVKPLMEKYLSHLPIYIYIHIYNKTESMKNSEIKSYLQGDSITLNVESVIKKLRQKIDDNDNNQLSEFSYPKRLYKPDDSEAFHVVYDDKNYYISVYDIEMTWNSLKSTGILPRFNYPSIIELNQDFDRFNKLWLSLSDYIAKISVQINNRELEVITLKNLQQKATSDMNLSAKLN